MNLFKFKGNLEERLGMAWWLMAVWTALMAASLYWNLHQARHTALKLACAEAHLAYNKDLSYRLWAAEHGGVYVIVTPQTPPNPHLSFFKDRDIKTPSGRTLTLVNPAYMTRQVQELAGRFTVPGVTSPASSPYVLKTPPTLGRRRRWKLSPPAPKTRCKGWLPWRGSPTGV